MREKWFTLIELLIVIAIIAILAAMLLPVLHQVRRQAELISCVSNSKNIGVVVRGYADDYKGFVPNGNTKFSDVWTQQKYGGEYLLSWYGLMGLGKAFCPGVPDTTLVKANELDRKTGKVLYCSASVNRGTIKRFANQLYGAYSDTDSLAYRRTTYRYYAVQQTNGYSYYLKQSVLDSRSNSAAAIKSYGNTGRLDDVARWKGFIAYCAYYRSSDNFPINNGHQNGSTSVAPVLRYDGSVDIIKSNYSNVLAVSRMTNYEYCFGAFFWYFGTGNN